MAENATVVKRSRAALDVPLLKLAARFLVWATLLFGVITWLSVRTTSVEQLQTATAAVAAALMNASGVVATRAATLITIPGRQLAIGADCTGLTIATIFSALVLAYPVRISSRALGILGGVGAIVVANLLRLVAIAHLAPAPDWLFYGLHDFLFQVGMVAVAVAVWAYWLVYSRARES